MFNCGGAKCLADVEASEPSTLQTSLDHIFSFRNRFVALGRQLRASIRFHIRISTFLRFIAFHIVRSLRQAQENISHMGLFSGRMDFVHMPRTSILHYPRL